MLVRCLCFHFGGERKETAMVGAGGTIGFVQPFADLLKGAPCIRMGVADPNTRAHSENESLHLGACRGGSAAAPDAQDAHGRA